MMAPVKANGNFSCVLLSGAAFATTFPTGAGDGDLPRPPRRLAGCVPLSCAASTDTFPAGAGIGDMPRLPRRFVGWRRQRGISNYSDVPKESVPLFSDFFKETRESPSWRLWPSSAAPLASVIHRCRFQPGGFTFFLQ